MVVFLTDPITILGNNPAVCTHYCHIVGGGYGDLSSERVYIRLEKMICKVDDAPYTRNNSYRICCW